MFIEQQEKLEHIQKQLEGKNIIAVDFETFVEDDNLVTPGIILLLDDGEQVTIKSDGIEIDLYVWFSLTFDKKLPQACDHPSKYDIRKKVRDLDVVNLTLKQCVGMLMRTYKGQANPNIIIEVLREFYQFYPEECE